MALKIINSSDDVLRGIFYHEVQLASLSLFPGVFITKVVCTSLQFCPRSRNKISVNYGSISTSQAVEDFSFFD